MGNSKKANDSALFRMALVVAMIILATAGIVIGVANVVKKPAEDISSEQPTVAEDDTASSAASEPTEEVSVVQTPVDFSAWKAVNDEISGWKSPIQISATPFCRAPNPTSIICDGILTEHRTPTAAFSLKERITVRALPTA